MDVRFDRGALGKENMFLASLQREIKEALYVDHNFSTIVTIPEINEQ
jgi:hypothetical protein